MNQLNLISYNESNSTQFFDLLKQLRPNLTPSSFRAILEEAREKSGYQLVGLESDGHLAALMGYRILCDFVHGRHLYIDDLVTSEAVRSKGHGAALLKHAEQLAEENGCANLRLCTGIENQRGKDFYEKNAWNLRAVVFKKKL